MRNLREGCLVELDIKYLSGVVVRVFQSADKACVSKNPCGEIPLERQEVLHEIGPHLLVKKTLIKQNFSHGRQPAFEDIFDCLILAGERLFIIPSYAIQEYKEI